MAFGTLAVVLLIAYRVSSWISLQSLPQLLPTRFSVT